MTSVIPDRNATKDDPTDPLLPTMYPSDSDFATSFTAIMYSVENPYPMIAPNSLSMRFCTISGRFSP